MTIVKRFIQINLVLSLRVGIVAASTLLLLGSCAGGGAVEETVNVDGVSIPARIKIATASVGGSYYPVGTAIAQVLNELPGVAAAAEVSSGSSQNLRMLDANQIHFGLSNAAITFPAIKGVESFEKPFAVRAVISLHRSVVLFVALKDDGITTFGDLEGKRVAVGPAGAGWDYFVRPILAAHGVDYDSFRHINEGQANATEFLTDGSVDAIIVGGSIPHATIMAANATDDLEYLEFDEAALDGVTAEYPFIRKFSIPAGTYKGQDQEFMAADSGTAQLVVRADADPDYVYLVTKTIYENRDKIAEMHRAGEEITPERAAMDIGIPYHEGSLRYFSEIGIWNPQTDLPD